MNCASRVSGEGCPEEIPRSPTDTSPELSQACWLTRVTGFVCGCGPELMRAILTGSPLASLVRARGRSVLMALHLPGGGDCSKFGSWVVGTLTLIRDNALVGKLLVQEW